MSLTVVFSIFLIWYLQTSGDPTGGILCIGVIVIVIIALIVSSNKKQRERDEARTRYQNSLSKLKSDPTNPDLRERTLQLGRAYSNLTRNRRGVTIFDEVALMNDINAACAGAASVSQQFGQGPDHRSLEQRLERLAELKSKGLIDDQEYTTKRQKILDEV